MISSSDTPTLNPNSPGYVELNQTAGSVGDGTNRSGNGSGKLPEPGSPQRQLSTPAWDAAVSYLQTQFPGATNYKKGSDGNWYVGYPKTTEQIKGANINFDGNPNIADLLQEGAGNTNWVPVSPIKNPEAYDIFALGDAERAAALKAKGSVATWAETESGKADEIDRQLNDFLKRAKGTYDLMDSEQARAMRANDQNVKNLKAAREGLLVYPGDYVVPSMENAYSARLAPSVPQEVAPIYQLNQTVGLPGAEGFNNPNYNSSGSLISDKTVYPEFMWGKPTPAFQDANGKDVYIDANGNATYTPPSGEPMMAMGTDYYAMLMRKLITGGA